MSEPSACCSPAAQASCCEPSAKEACCGTEATSSEAGASCGCAAGQGELERGFCSGGGGRA